jgi:hypothetical protein
MADDDCIPGGLYWNLIWYSETVRLADIDGQPGDEPIDWGGQGIEAWQRR